MGFISLPHLFVALSCTLFGISCASTSVPLPLLSGTSSEVVVQEFASSSPDVTIVTSVNGSTTIEHASAPHGFSTTVVSRTENGHTETYATTTPLSPSDVQAMRAHMDREQAALQAHIQQMIDDQEQMFRDFQERFSNF